TAITLIAALATAGVGFSGAARAMDYTAAPENQIDITARPLPDRAPVSMMGTVVESHGDTLLLHRADGVVRAQLPHNVAMQTPLGRDIPVFASVFQPGDNITVYGKLDKNGDMIKVKADSIYMPTSADHATLFLLNNARLQSISKLNLQPNAKAAL